MSEPRYDHPLTPWTGSGEDHGNGARLELKPNFPRTGFVDGGWWPRSRDLRAELPDLIASLSAQLGGRVGPILRIGFGITEWNPTGRQRLVTPTGHVAFGGWKVFERDVVWMVSHSTALMPITLVVIPPETPHGRAMATLRRASTADNTERPAELLEQAAGSSDQPAEPADRTPSTADTRQRA